MEGGTGKEAFSELYHLPPSLPAQHTPIPHFVPHPWAGQAGRAGAGQADISHHLSTSSLTCSCICGGGWVGGGKDAHDELAAGLPAMLPMPCLCLHMPAMRAALVEKKEDRN